MKKKVDSIKDQIENELFEKDLKHLLATNKQELDEETKLLRYMESLIFETLADKMDEINFTKDPQE